jgi:peptide/nickel transport system substrate-binding protein
MRNALIILIWGLLFLQCISLSSQQTVIEGIDDFPENLDPADNFSPTAIRIISTIYEPLLKLDIDCKTLLPCLAKSWKNSPDYRIFTFDLKQGIYFHDGTPLHSETVKFAFERQITKNRSYPLFNMIDSIYCGDSLSLTIQLKYSYSLFPYTLTSPYGLRPISKKAIIEYGDNIASHPTGTGPYKLDRFTKNNEIILIANERYRTVIKNRGNVIFRYFNDYSQLEPLFKKGKIDIFGQIPGFSVDRLKWFGLIDYKTIKPSSTIFIGFNIQNSPLSNILVRRAILKAIDINGLVYNVLRGNSIMASGPLPPILFNYKNIQQETYNLEIARKLLNEAGYKNGLKLKLYYLDAFRARRTPFEVIKSNLNKINIQIELTPFYSSADLLKACRSDSSQLFWTSWGSDVLGDPENYLYSLFYSKSEYNFFHYQNTRVDSWIEKSRMEADPGMREVFYIDIMKQILDDTPAVFLYHVIPHFAYNRKKIKELPVDPYGIIQYHQIVLNE